MLQKEWDVLNLSTTKVLIRKAFSTSPALPMEPLSALGTSMYLQPLGDQVTSPQALQVGRELGPVLVGAGMAVVIQVSQNWGRGRDRDVFLR